MTTTVTLTDINGNVIAHENIVGLHIANTPISRPSPYPGKDIRGGQYGVENLKAGVGVIANSVQMFFGKVDAGTVFGAVSNAYSAFSAWHEMWQEVKELDWDDALELGKAVVSGVLPFIGGLFGTKDLAREVVARKFAALEQYAHTTRSIEGYTDEELKHIGNTFYTQVFPHFTGVEA